jgi:hypothetical protein
VNCRRQWFVAQNNIVGNGAPEITEVLGGCSPGLDIGPDPGRPRRGNMNTDPKFVSKHATCISSVSPVRHKANSADLTGAPRGHRQPAARPPADLGVDQTQ